MTRVLPDDVGLGEAIKELEQAFREAGLENPRLDARLIVTHAMNCLPEVALTNPEQPLSVNDIKKAEALALRRLNREPVAYLLGQREFWSQQIEVTEHTLIPRPDTETLVDCILSEIPGDQKTSPLSILDLGTGSGCILVALLSEMPNATGLGVDASYPALEVARRNADRADVSNRMRVQYGDWLSGIEERFDIVVSNPPYIASDEILSLESGVSAFEPHGALDGGTDGLDAYRDLAPGIGHVLKPNGLAAFEVGIGQFQDVAEIFQKSGFSNVKFQCDLSGIERVVLVTKSE